MRWVLLATVLLFVGAATVSSQEPNDRKPIAYKEKISEQNATATKNPPSLVKKDETEVGKETRNASDAHANEKIQIDRQLAEYSKQLALYTKELSEDTSSVATFTALLVGVTALLAIIAIWQGFQLKSTVKVTKESVDLARQEFLSTHRPKIILRDAFCNDNEIGNPIVVTYTLVNIGETGARIVLGGVEVQVITGGTFSPDQAPSVNEGCSGIDGLFLEPGEERKMTHYSHRHWRTDDSSRHAFSENLFGVFFCGHLIYEDDRKVRRHTAFWRKYDLAASRFYVVDHPALKALEYSD